LAKTTITSMALTAATTTKEAPMLALGKLLELTLTDHEPADVAGDDDHVHGPDCGHHH